MEITVEESILQEVTETLNVRADKSQQFYRPEDVSYYIYAESEDEFIKALRTIFNTSKSRKVLTALLSQSDPTWTGVVAMTNGAEKIDDEDSPF